MFLRALQKLPQNVQHKWGGVDGAEYMIKDTSEPTVHVRSKIENAINFQK